MVGLIKIPSVITHSPKMRRTEPQNMNPVGGTLLSDHKGNVKYTAEAISQSSVLNLGVPGVEGW
jgi:hypothetical protein